MIINILSQSADVVGIVGVVVLLIAYYLLSTDKISSQSFGYQISNLLGAIFILYSLAFNFNLASFLIESSWVVISIIGIYRIRSESREPNNI